MSAYSGRFAGRMAIVTGGASGLGKCSAERIIQEGGQVSLWDLNGDALADAAAEIGAQHFVALDVSERAFQLERGGTWDKGKGCDTFGPVGPWLVTKDEVGDVQNLGMWLEVNGKRVQDGSSSTMIFGVAKLVAYVSEFMTLEPGDIITTGTPKGVGMGQKPEPWFLKAGDVIELGIEKLGRQRQNVVAWSPNGAAA